jgi:hypothetical protein
VSRHITTTTAYQGIHPGSEIQGEIFFKVKFKDFSRTSRPFFSKFKDLELGKIFENGTDLPITLHSVILIKMAQLEVKEINSRTFKDFY